MTEKKRFYILGMGRSGLSAARLLRSRGAEVVIADEADEKRLCEPLQELSGLGVQMICGGFADPQDVRADVIVICPGIPRDNRVVRVADKLGITVWGELELASRFLANDLIAVTGTNGKTTTASWIHHLLITGGRDSILAGNIGMPLSSLVSEFDRDTVGVVEVSSYQLETVDTFHPKVAVITNLSPDHLERHGSMEQYRAVKARIFANQRPGDVTVLNGDDHRVRSLASRVPGEVLQFSMTTPVEGAYVSDGTIVLRRQGREEAVVAVSELGIRGAHNVQNALAAVCAASGIGLSAGHMVEGLMSFRGVEHRMETVTVLDGVTYINDSKATNPESVIMALEAISEPVVLILGGSPKNASYDGLAQVIGQRDVRTVLTGQTAGEIGQALERAGVMPVAVTETLQEAVDQARRLAKPGETVMLSPACASFDAFRNFEHRGSAFKEIVHGYGNKTRHRESGH